MMGSDDAADDEMPAHSVTIDYSFGVGKYEVSQSEWRAVMGGNPANFKADDYPVDKVSWHDVQHFIAELNINTGETYRPLSEAEWECMARAGTITRWSCGSERGCLGLVGYSVMNATGINPVGRKQANDFGIHDAHGNVWEWVADCYAHRYEGAPTNGSVRSETDQCKRVLRGGSVYYVPWILRSAARYAIDADRATLGFGFRLAKTL